MITPLDSYSAYQAERPRSRAEQLAEDARAAGLAASLSHGPAVLAGIGRRLGRLAHGSALRDPRLNRG